MEKLIYTIEIIDIFKSYLSESTLATHNATSYRSDKRPMPWRISYSAEEEEFEGQPGSDRARDQPVPRKELITA